MAQLKLYTLQNCLDSTDTVQYYSSIDYSIGQVGIINRCFVRVDFNTSPTNSQSPNSGPVCEDIYCKCYKVTNRVDVLIPPLSDYYTFSFNILYDTCEGCTGKEVKKDMERKASSYVADINTRCDIDILERDNRNFIEILWKDYLQKYYRIACDVNIVDRLKAMVRFDKNKILEKTIDNCIGPICMPYCLVNAVFSGAYPVVLCPVMDIISMDVSNCMPYNIRELIINQIDNRCESISFRCPNAYTACGVSISTITNTCNSFDIISLSYSI